MIANLIVLVFFGLILKIYATTLGLFFILYFAASLTGGLVYLIKTEFTLEEVNYKTFFRFCIRGGVLSIIVINFLPLAIVLAIPYTGFTLAEKVPLEVARPEFYNKMPVVTNDNYRKGEHLLFCPTEQGDVSSPFWTKNSVGAPITSSWHKPSSPSAEAGSAIEYVNKAKTERPSLAPRSQHPSDKANYNRWVSSLKLTEKSLNGSKFTDVFLDVPDSVRKRLTVPFMEGEQRVTGGVIKFRNPGYGREVLVERLIPDDPDGQIAKGYQASSSQRGQALGINIATMLFELEDAGVDRIRLSAFESDTDNDTVLQMAKLASNKLTGQELESTNFLIRFSIINEMAKL